MKPSNRPRKALIVGGSLGGLLAGNMLRRAGWEVEIFERAEDDLASRGAGIGTHEELLEVMARIGITIDDSIGVHPASRVCLDGEGKTVREVPLPRILSSWARLYRPLKDIFPAVQYHFGATFVRYEESARDVTAHFADGSRATGDLLIGADGIRSAVRGQLFPGAQPRYAGYVAWRGIIDERAMRPELHADIFMRNVFCLPEGEMMTAYPTPGPDNDVSPGRRAYTFVWYHPVDGNEGLRDLCTDATGKWHGIGIAPPLIRPEVIADIRRVARSVLAPQIAEVIEITAQPFFQAIYDLESPHMRQGRIALLGDAAFVARPHLGMGVTKAALDAECLANSLGDADNDLDAALSRYHREQHRFGTAVVARARKLGAHLEAQLSKPRELRTEEELFQDPAIVMRNIGARLRDIPELITLVHATRRSRSRSASEQEA